MAGLNFPNAKKNTDDLAVLNEICNGTSAETNTPNNEKNLSSERERRYETLSQAYILDHPSECTHRYPRGITVRCIHSALSNNSGGGCLP